MRLAVHYFFGYHAVLGYLVLAIAVLTDYQKIFNCESFFYLTFFTTFARLYIIK